MAAQSLSPLPEMVTIIIWSLLIVGASFITSATTGAGREVGRQVSRSILGIFGIGSGKKK